jgi:transcriptional regulator with XRE-family HTH domain
MPKRNPYTCLQDALIVARHAQSLTQVQVAHRLGKPQSFVSKYESGERRLDVIEFIEVCKVLNVKPTLIIRQLEINDD